MNVNKTIQLGNQCKIELGKSTWDKDEDSIRLRFENSNGGFNPHASSELPIWGLNELMKAWIGHGEVNSQQAGELIKLLAQKL
jgi:hypothetical protein